MTLSRDVIGKDVNRSGESAEAFGTFYIIGHRLNSYPYQHWLELAPEKEKNQHNAMLPIPQSNSEEYHDQWCAESY